jgi:hypothetical protein
MLSSVLAAAPIARAISAPGYSITEIALPDFAQGDVVVAGGALFVGVGPGFTGAGQAVVRIDGGGTTVVANGFNSLGGFAYDAVNDRLLVVDNADEALGSETGDTLYSIPNPNGTFATPLRAKNIAVAPAGSIPGASDIVLDPTDPTGNRAFVTDASESFPPAGRLLSVDLSSGALSVLQTGLGFAAGLAANGTTLYLGDVNGFSFAGDVSSVALPGATGARTPVAGGLAGQYDLELASDGSLLSTSVSDLLRIDPTTGVATSIASGFGFATGLFAQDGTIWVLDGGFPGVAKAYRLDLVPEPGTIVLVAAGCAFLGARRRSADR